MKGIVIISTWLMGIFLAKGFFSTLFACIFPPWGWYLVVEAIAVKLGS